MLSIFLGDMDGAIYHPPTYFDNRYEDEWITEPLSVAMIKDVDKSEVVSARLILKIGQEKDLTINLRHIMDFGQEPFEARILNTDTIVHNMSEFVYIAGSYV